MWLSSLQIAILDECVRAALAHSQAGVRTATGALGTQDIVEQSSKLPITELSIYTPLRTTRTLLQYTRVRPATGTVWHRVTDWQSLNAMMVGRGQHPCGDGRGPAGGHCASSHGVSDSAGRCSSPVTLPGDLAVKAFLDYVCHKPSVATKLT